MKLSFFWVKSLWSTVFRLLSCVFLYRSKLFLRSKTARSQRITDDQHVVSDNSATQNILKTPPTVKRTVPEPLQFVDAMEFEVDGGLLLAESLGTAVDNMDSETLTRELIRNHTSIAGNEDQKKARLQQRLSMTIGELTSTAANNSVNVAHLLSPTESVENFRQDLERVSNSQACIENTLTKVIESIVNIREDVTGIRANNVVLKDELSKPPPSQMTLPGIKELSHQVAECAAKIQQLNENIAAVREDLASVQDSVVITTSLKSHVPHLIHLITFFEAIPIDCYLDQVSILLR